ncbi:MAG: aldehyde dehydrogenase [Lachnospiraceae bacterium]|nr:aldehyde dehydrogenase [Lachnospiraceae bacterium]
MQIEKLVQKQRAYYMKGKTFDISARIHALHCLEQAIASYEERLYDALQKDLGKSKSEAYMCEIGLALSEIRYLKRHIRSWSRERLVRTPLAQFHAKSFTVQEPYGVVLVMSPWNYPVLLTLEPLAGALAAGNCCVIKPSAYASQTSRVLAEMIREYFQEDYVAVVEGGRTENQSLLEQKFDYIFFTGGVNVGKMVMEKAAAHLTPVTLELGGKSPCIVDHTANLRLTAKRLVFGKYLNCGQTCVAPDYVLAERSIKEELLQYILEEIKAQFGDKPLENLDYGKIINHKHFERLLSLIDSDKLVYGGAFDAEACRLEPTVLDGITESDAVMQEEIFGPILPILTVDSAEEAFVFVKNRPQPLALYLFTGDTKTEARFLNEIPFGGGCVNDTIIHLATEEMGFGGVGNSGMGSYHGKKSFETFSHEKSIVKKFTWIDLPMRYQPYTSWKEKMVRRFLK